jgi:outer membrane immunogenic protein
MHRSIHRELLVTVFSCGALAALPFAANAADIPVKAPPQAPAVYGWSGLYIGANGGYGWREAKTVTFTPNDPFTTTTSVCNGVAGTTCPATNHLRGGFGGFQIGYNRQVSQSWLFGIEFDLNAARIRGTGTGAGFQTLGGATARFVEQQDIRWFGTLRSRLGFLPTQSLLVYATGGLAFAGVDQSAAFNISTTAGAGPIGGFGAFCFPANGSFPTCYRGTSSRAEFGWTAGGGFEFAAWQNVSVKTEYLYVGLPSHSVTVTAIAPAPGGGPASYTAHFTRPIFTWCGWV